jgi:hypothetical protein
VNNATLAFSRSDALTVGNTISGTGAVTLNGTWSDTSADNTGTAGHYRMTNGSDIEEGTVTATGGGGDLTLDNTSITSGQTVTITSWTRTMPAA